MNYEGLQYAHDEHEIQEECSRLKDILDAKKSLYQRLKRRCTEMERVMQSEKEKRDVRIEQSVRDEATRASDELKGMVPVIPIVHSIAVCDSKQVQRPSGEGGAD